MSYHLSQHARHNEQDPLLAVVATNAGRVTTTISNRTNTTEALESLWKQRHHHHRRFVRTLVCVVGAGLTLLVFTFLYEKNTKNKNDTVCFGKTNDTAAYACPDTNGIPLSSITLPWGGIRVQFPQIPVEQWETPSTNFVNFVANAQGVMGPVLAVLHTTGTYNANTTKRPSGTFYMCGPLQGLNGDACTAKTCGPHSHADYSNTGWDQGHMVSNHEGGLFAGGEQNTFSMCNIWPQGKQFNEQWWQHLEYTTDGYALTTESLILTGPIFANGTNTCMGIFNPEPASGNRTAPSSKTTGPTVPCETTPHSPIPIPSHFFKLLVDVDEKIYWTFLATNDAGPVPQLVPEMLSTWDAIRKMPGVLALPMNLRQAGYIEQHCVVNYTKPDTAVVSMCSNTTPELIVRHSPPY